MRAEPGLRTKMRLDTLALLLRHRELLKVEDIYRATKIDPTIPGGSFIGRTRSSAA